MSARFGAVYLNGRIIPHATAEVSILDRSVMFGDGLYETMLARQGKVFRLAEHLERMRAGMLILRMGLEPEDLNLETAVQSAIDASGFDESRVRLMVTRGMFVGSYSADKAEQPTVVVTVQDITGALTLGSVDAIISSYRRDETSPLTRAKTLNVLPSIMARSEAHDADAGDAIMLNMSGCVAEATSSNIFLVATGRLITPDINSGILAGVTRRAILEIAHSMNLPIEERTVRAEELETADEIFLTSSIAGLRAVVNLNKKIVGKGECKIKDQLAEEYARLLVLEIG